MSIIYKCIPVSHCSQSSVETGNCRTVRHISRRKLFLQKIPSWFQEPNNRILQWIWYNSPFRALEPFKSSETHQWSRTMNWINYCNNWRCYPLPVSANLTFTSFRVTASQTTFRVCLVISSIFTTATHKEHGDQCFSWLWIEYILSNSPSDFFASSARSLNLKYNRLSMFDIPAAGTIFL